MNCPNRYKIVNMPLNICIKSNNFSILCLDKVGKVGPKCKRTVIAKFTSELQPSNDSYKPEFANPPTFSALLYIRMHV